MKRAVLLITLLASAICISYADTQQVVDCGKQIEVSATPSTGYHFIRWHDGITDNPRLVTPTSDMEFTAVFEKDGDVPCPTTYGSVSATAEGSYVWFGETYTQSGQYQHTIKNVAGCDSIITLDLTITHSQTGSQQVVDCGKEIEISAIPSDGYHFVQWQDGNKDNPRTITPTSNMEFTAVFEKDTDVPCQTTYGSVSATAEDSYEWYGETYTLSGQYQHTIQNVAGCDSVITLNLTITSVIVPCQTTYSNESVTAESSYVWFGETYTKSGTYQHIIQNVAGCDSIITLDLTITNTPAEMQQVVDCGKEIEISAIPSDGYHFVQWQDGNKDNPRTVTPTSDMEFIAVFEKDTDVPCQTTYGSVNATAEGSYVWFGDTYTKSGQYQHTIQNVTGCDSIITLNLTITSVVELCKTTYGTVTATAEGSYVWYGETYTQSGQYQHTIQNVAGCDSVITLNLTITCKPYSFDVHTNDLTMGTIEIIEEPSCDNDNLLILQAVANEHYHFVQWSDGNTDAKREIYLTHDLILNALFVEDIYQVNLSSNNPAYGRITGSGSYAYGTEVVITAVPGNRYEFVQWSDGNTDNPRTLIVTGDISLQAQFEELYFTITVESNDTSMGTVTGSGRYAALSTATIKAEAKTGYKFIMWDDGNRQAERSILVVDNETYTAIFAEAITYHIEAVAANNAMGTVTGSGDYPVGAEAVLEAHPKENYQFIKWNDEVTDNPRTIIVTGDARYMAYFLVGSGLEDNELHGVYVSGNQIFIDGHEEQTMQIYTITGQTIYSGAVKSQFTLLYNGVYLIRIGNQIAKIVI